MLLSKSILSFVLLSIPDSIDQDLQPCQRVYRHKISHSRRPPHLLIVMQLMHRLISKAGEDWGVKNHQNHRLQPSVIRVSLRLEFIFLAGRPGRGRPADGSRGAAQDAFARRCEDEHLKALAVASGCGLVLITAGMNVQLRVPFVLMLAAFAVALGGLILTWWLMQKQNQDHNG